MTLTELEAVHAKVVLMNCYEFEQWLAEYSEEESHLYDDGHRDGYAQGYAQGYSTGYNDGENP